MSHKTKKKIARIAKGASLTQLLHAARNVEASVTGSGSEIAGWILKIEPRDKSKEFFAELFKIIVRDKVRAVYPSPLDLMRH